MMLSLTTGGSNIDINPSHKNSYMWQHAILGQQAVAPAPQAITFDLLWPEEPAKACLKASALQSEIYGRRFVAENCVAAVGSCSLGVWELESHQSGLQRAP